MHSDRRQELLTLERIHRSPIASAGGNHAQAPGDVKLSVPAVVFLCILGVLLTLFALRISGII